MTENEPRLRLEAGGVSKSYGAVKALDDVQFQLRAGEGMAPLGENGAGKSTIVKVISGLVSPDAGEISIDGEVTDIHSSAKAQQAGIAVVQQEYSSVPTMTVAENLVLGKADSGVFWPRRRLAREARDLLELVGLASWIPARSWATSRSLRCSCWRSPGCWPGTRASSSSTNPPRRSRTPRSSASPTWPAIPRAAASASSTCRTVCRRSSRSPPG